MAEHLVSVLGTGGTEALDPGVASGEGFGGGISGAISVKVDMLHATYRMNPGAHFNMLPDEALQSLCILKFDHFH